VYLAGRVVYKRSTSYEQFAHGAEAETLAQKLHERLAKQHREVIAELEGGTRPFRPRKKRNRLPKSQARTTISIASKESEKLVRGGKCDS